MGAHEGYGGGGEAGEGTLNGVLLAAAASMVEVVGDLRRDGGWVWRVEVESNEELMDMDGWRESLHSKPLWPER